MRCVVLHRWGVTPHVNHWDFSDEIIVNMWKTGTARGWLQTVFVVIEPHFAMQLVCVHWGDTTKLPTVMMPQ